MSCENEKLLAANAFNGPLDLKSLPLCSPFSERTFPALS